MENTIMKPLVPAGLILICNIASPAAAQVTLDVSKITCDQFSGYKITSPDNIAIWLSGYYSGKRDSTIVDTQNLLRTSKNCSPIAFATPRLR
jgi:acid stress chaperone HdeB